MVKTVLLIEYFNYIIWKHILNNTRFRCKLLSKEIRTLEKISYKYSLQIQKVHESYIAGELVFKERV